VLSAANEEPGSHEEACIVTRIFRILYVTLAWAFLLGVAVQVFLAGLAIFGRSIFWVTHREFGYLLGWLPMSLILIGLLGRVGRPIMGRSLLLFALYIVHSLLIWVRGEAPAVAALHPVNAIALFWLALWLARRSTAALRREPGAAARELRSAEVAQT
jgi:hypothetical protein